MVINYFCKMRRTLIILLAGLCWLSSWARASTSCDLPPFGGDITGTVTGPDGSTPLSGIIITAFVDNGQWWQGALTVSTDSNGFYKIAAGAYMGKTCKLMFSDPKGDYLWQYYSNTMVLASATSCVFPFSGSVSNIDATLNRGSKIAGFVSDKRGTPLAGIDVAACRWDGADWEWGWYYHTNTDSNGCYQVTVNTGTFKVEFGDSLGNYVGMFYTNADWYSATLVEVPENGVISNINASLDITTDALIANFTSFTPAGTFVWSNRISNLFCGLQWTYNLGYEWLAVGNTAPFWNQQSTQMESRVEWRDINAVFEQLSVVRSNLGDSGNGVFFRVVSSQDPLDSQNITNSINVVNVGTDVLSNITIGIRDTYGDVPYAEWLALNPGATSDVVRVWFPWITGNSISSNITAMMTSTGWYASYNQAGTNRTLVMPLIPFGPAEKTVFLIVNDDSGMVKTLWNQFVKKISY